MQLWLGRAASGSSFSDRVSGKAWNRSAQETEQSVIDTRTELKLSALGEMGAEAIRRTLLEQGRECPSVRTVSRILARSGALDRKVRVRRPPPPLGWHLPNLATREVELDSFDAVIGLVIRGGVDVEVLNGVSLHGGLVASWPLGSVTTDATLPRLLEHWREFGLPAYAQFDNDARFYGNHKHPDSLGRVVRQCLSLGVTPVFAPPREQGFQNAVESYNGKWQTKVWNRFQHESLETLCACSDNYVKALRKRLALRIEAAPKRTPFPKDWRDKRRHPLIGKVIFIRRSDEAGCVSFLGRTFQTLHSRPHRLVRAEVLYEEGRIDFYALRRAEPLNQPLLNQLTYTPKKE